MWIKAVLDAHGKHLRENAGQYAPEMRQVQSQITRIQRELTSLADNNTYMMEYLLSQAQNSNGKLVDSNGFESQENVDMSVIDSGPDAVFSDEGSWLGVD